MLDLVEAGLGLALIAEAISASGALRGYGCADGSYEQGVEHGDGKGAAGARCGAVRSRCRPAVWCQFIQERRDFLVALRQTVDGELAALFLLRV